MNEDNKNLDPIDNDDPSADSAPDPQGSTGDDENKTFTQDELDSIVEARLARERKKIPPKEELAAFKAWQAEQKKGQPEDEQAAEYKNKYEQAQAELRAYKNREAVVSKGVNPKFAEFVAFETQKLVDDDSDFEDALDAWLKDNPHYSEKPEDTPPSGGMRHKASPQKKTSGVFDAFYAKNPDLKPQE